MTTRTEAKAVYTRIAGKMIATFGITKDDFRWAWNSAKGDFVDGEDDNTTPKHWVRFAHEAAWVLANERKQSDRLTYDDFVAKYGDTARAALDAPDTL